METEITCPFVVQHVKKILSVTVGNRQSDIIYKKKE